jgi:hypothetical protein
MSRTGNQPPGESPPTVREPARNFWPWVGLALLVLAGIPWYLPAGTIGPIVFGLPLWTVVAMASSVAVAAYLSWMIARHWNVVEDLEESTGEPVGPDTPLDGLGEKG